MTPIIMENTTNPQSNSGYTKEISLERFIEHYPHGTIREIRLKDIPSNAMDFFEAQSARFITLDEYKKGNFDSSFIINHDSGYDTYVTSQITYYKYTSKTTEKLIHLFETTKNLTKIGHGEIRYDFLSKREFFTEKPFVGYTNTEEEYRRKGFGIQRLRVMNALTYMFFNLPLNSDNTIWPSAKRCWERLAEVKEAEKYVNIITIAQENGKTKKLVQERYVFLK
jgi:hypothetical protein